MVVWSALTSPRTPDGLMNQLTRRDSAIHWQQHDNGSTRATRTHRGHTQQLEVRTTRNTSKENPESLPDICSRDFPKGAQSMVIVSEDL